MRSLTALCLATAALVLSGCRSDDAAERIVLRDVEDIEDVAAQTRVTAVSRDPLDTFDRATKEGATVFLGADEAPECPTIRLASSLQAKPTKVRPGAPGYAERGTVTIVVFWSADVISSMAAVRHVSDLVRTYGRLNVRGLSVVEKTKNAAVAAPFIERKRLSGRLLYDDFSALKRLSARIDAEARTAVPSIFIIDREGRLRFYRGTFQFWEEVLPDGEGLHQAIKESAPEGERIKDYLELILAEQLQLP